MEDFWIHKYERGIENKKALLIFPHWNAPLWPYKLFGKYFPYFHTVVYHCAGSLLSADVEATIKNFALLEKTVLDDVVNLKTSGISQFNTYGVSLGTVMAARIANLLVGRRECVGGIVLNLSCASLPFSVWAGSATQLITKALKRQNVDYLMLEKAWHHLSPIENLSNLKAVKILLFASKNDAVMGPSNVLRLADALRDFSGAETRFNAWLGHYSGGAKNFLCLRAVRKFLEKN